MARVTVEDCLDHVDNRFDLVMLATRRARSLRTYGNEPLVMVLLDDVLSLNFRFLQTTDEWIEQWPAQGTQGPSLVSARPRAVEIVLTLPDEGEIRRVVEVAP